MTVQKSSIDTSLSREAEFKKGLSEIAQQITQAQVHFFQLVSHCAESSKQRISYNDVRSGERIQAPLGGRAEQDESILPKSPRHAAS